MQYVQWGNSLVQNTSVIGENRNFLGEEDLLRQRKVIIEVLDEPNCIELMSNFILSKPLLWNEDIGT